MEIRDVIFYSIIIIYSGIILGIVIRFIEEKKPYLILFAPFIPIMILFFNIKLLYKVLFMSNKKIYNRIKLFFSYLHIMVKYYNILVQFNVKLFIDSKLNLYLKNIVKDITNFEILFEVYNHPVKNVYDTNQDFIKSGLKIS